MNFVQIGVLVAGFCFVVALVSAQLQSTRWWCQRHHGAMGFRTRGIPRCATTTRGPSRVTGHFLLPSFCASRKTDTTEFVVLHMRRPRWRG